MTLQLDSGVLRWLGFILWISVMVAGCAKMAHDAEMPRRNWQLFESTLLLRKCLRTLNLKRRQLKKALIENNFNEVCALLEGKEHQLNKLLNFSADGCTLYVPPLCVAICHQNLPVVQLLLQHGANPNRLGRIHIQKKNSDSGTLASVSPLMMAVEDHRSEGFPFHPAIASALVDAGADINSTAGCVIEEEEEEGGSIHYNAPDTLLHKSVDVYLPHSSAVFSFLLDKGANLFIRDAQGGFTPLQKCLYWLTEFPDDARLRTCAGELIRHGGFTSCSTSSGSNESELGLLLNALTKAVENSRDTAAIRHSAHLLIDAGYVCTQDDVGRFKASEARNVDSCLMDKVNGLHVYSLKHLCRRRVRNSVQHHTCLDQLTGVPESVMDYLKLK